LLRAAEYLRILERRDSTASAKRTWSSVALTAAEVAKIEQALILLPDAPAAYVEWKRLMLAHGVIGVKVHDARLVAAMNVHGVRRILSFNVDDFKRYEIEVLHPSSVLAGEWRR
jgi:predicted nucleic acid-binding protein